MPGIINKRCFLLQDLKRYRNAVVYGDRYAVVLAGNPFGHGFHHAYGFAVAKAVETGQDLHVAD